MSRSSHMFCRDSRESQYPESSSGSVRTSVGAAGVLFTALGRGCRRSRVATESSPTDCGVGKAAGWVSEQLMAAAMGKGGFDRSGWAACRVDQAGPGDLARGRNGEHLARDRGAQSSNGRLRNGSSAEDGPRQDRDACGSQCHHQQPPGADRGAFKGPQCFEAGRRLFRARGTFSAPSTAEPTSRLCRVYCRHQ